MAAAHPSRNQFLAGLTVEDSALLRSQLVEADLRVGGLLYVRGDRINEVVFPHSGVAVLRASLRDGAGTGLALIGRDGVVGGFAAKASAPATCDCEILIEGKASYMTAAAFRYALDRSPTLRHWSSQFDNALMAQTQQTALCNATHSVEARMCRWLLEVHERSDDERIPLTQGALAELLGVRRTTVTVIAGELADAGAIDCRRGYMRVADRAALEQRCCECYAWLKSAARRLAPERDRALTAGAVRLRDGAVPKRDHSAAGSRS